MSDRHGTFDADWLALRESVDHVARAAALDDLLADALADTGERGQVLRVADLGCGTGSNLRHLAPRLGGRQHWLLLDADADLLDTARARLQAWADCICGRVTACADGLEIAAPGCDLSVTLRRANLAADGLPVPQADLVTGAALLDLVSRGWLARLADACAAHGVAVLFALTYDGSISWTPADAFDTSVVDLVNRHQRGDKGFGPALGPDAHATAVELFQARGYRVRQARADWRLAATDTALQQHLHAGWAAAASETMPACAEAIQAWLAHRMDLLEAGTGEVTVGHMDLLALPRDQAARRSQSNSVSAPIG